MTEYTTQEVEDSYELSSGLVDEFDGQILDAWFTVDNSYNADVTVLKLHVKALEPDVFPAEDQNTTELIFPCTKGFEATDKGARLIHDSGKPRKIHKSSGLGLLVGAVCELDGGVDLLKSRGPATSADIWKGLSFTFENREFSWKGSDGQEHTYTRMLPAAILEAGEGSAPAATNGSTNGSAEVSISPMLKGKLKALAGSTANYDQFMEQAFATLELDADAEAAVMSESFYASLASA